jgi:hypothetical protein
MNEVLVGVCSNDVLFTMSSDEVSLNIEGNRLARLAGHLLQQQSFSPQFPVPQSLLSQVRIVSFSTDALYRTITRCCGSDRL